VKAGPCSNDGDCPSFTKCSNGKCVKSKTA
jgi:hypothetical protein